MRTMAIVCTALLLLQSGCYRPAQNTVTGDQGEQLTVAVPDAIVVTQGDSTQFSLTVTRKKIDVPVEVTIAGLPQGVTVADGDLKFPEGTDTEFITVKTDSTAKPQKDVSAKVIATADKYTATALLRVTVQESLENRASRKKAFGEVMNARLTKVKQQLEQVEKHAKELEDESQRSVLLKKTSERYETLDHARKSYEKLLATPVELWEREIAEAESNVARAEESSQALLAEAKTVKQ